MSNGKIEYPCSVCKEQYCCCDRSISRNVQFKLEEFTCRVCRDKYNHVEVFYSVNGLNNHIELRHPKPLERLVVSVGSSNGKDM